MTETFVVLVWLAKATALLVMALGVTVALRRAPAGARYIVWLATLATLMLVPAISAWSPLSLAILPSAPVAAETSVPVSAPAVNEPVVGRASPVSRSQSADAPSSPAAKNISPLTMLLAAWAAVVGLLLAWLGLGAYSVRRILRNARTLEDDAWLKPLYETADRIDLEQAPRLVMSDAIEMPFACGLLQPTIVLPASAEGWTDARRRVVLFHELAHVRRRDLLGHTLGRIVCAFYWFHPLVWSAAKRLRAESERACDDLVLACGGARASDYANHLLDIVTGVRRHGAPATALPMANKREFEGRMLAILDPTAERTTPSRRQTVLLTVGLAAVSMTIAAVSPTRRIAQPAPDAVAQSQRDTNPTEIIVDTSRTANLVHERGRGRALGTGFDTNTRTSTRTSTQTQTSTQTATRTETHVGDDFGASASVQAKVTSAIATAFGVNALQNEQQRKAIDTALIGKILRTDRSADVRRAAAWALQGRRDGMPLLIERIKADADASVREMSAWGLAGFASAAGVAVLTDALQKDASSEVRATAAWALGNIGGGLVNTAALERALGDEDADVRERALWALGNHRLSALPAKVVSLLSDPDKDVRVLAAWVIAEVQDHSVIPAVRAAFLKEHDAQVQQAEFRALVFMGDRNEAVMDRALHSDDTDLRSRAVRMLAGQGPGIWPWPWPWPDPRPEP